MVAVTVCCGEPESTMMTLVAPLPVAKPPIPVVPPDAVTICGVAVPPGLGVTL